MKKNCFFTVLLFHLFVTASLLPAQDREGELVIIGVAGRLSNREKSIQAALDDAARRLSFFHSVGGQVTRRDRSGGGVFDFDLETDFQLAYDENLEAYRDKLRFDPRRDVFENNNAVFVVTRFSSGEPMPRAAGHSTGKERPLWVASPPARVGGFIAGIGFAGRRASHKDTVIASYENAVLALLENINTTVRGEYLSYQNNYSIFGLDTHSETASISEGSLKNFYVIESWTDPASLSVWTLAVAEDHKP